MTKDMKRVLKACEAHGFVIEYGGKHAKIRDPITNRTLPVSGTPNCPHAHKNVLRDLRRYWGVDVMTVAHG